MNAMLEKIRSAGALAWVRFVQWLNCGALAIAGVVVALNAMYPTAVQDASASLPPIAKLAVLAAWAALVHYALRRAAKSA